MKWYGVKSLYETAIRNGRTQKPSSPGSRLITERVVLIRARDTDDAIRRAEQEARSHVKGLRYRNRKGQAVQTKFLGALDAFAIDSNPDREVEVYSSMRIISPRTSKNAVMDMLLGPENIDEKEQRRRSAFEPWEPDNG